MVLAFLFARPQGALLATLSLKMHGFSTGRNVVHPGRWDTHGSSSQQTSVRQSGSARGITPLFKMTKDSQEMVNAAGVNGGTTINIHVVTKFGDESPRNPCPSSTRKQNDRSMLVNPECL